jgi:hypothetical protein
VLVEKTELFVVTRAQVLSGWCPGCNRQVDLIDLQKAACICGASRETIQGWIEMGKVHSRVEPEGRRLVCLVSLLASRAGFSPAYTRPASQFVTKACIALKDSIKRRFLP